MASTFFLLLWVGPIIVDCCLQRSAFDSLEKVLDFSAIMKTTVPMIYKASHKCVLVFVECDIIVPILPFILTIIVWDLQISFCLCGRHGHVIRAEKSCMHGIHFLCFNIHKQAFERTWHTEELWILNASDCQLIYALLRPSWVCFWFDFVWVMRTGQLSCSQGSSMHHI